VIRPAGAVIASAVGLRRGFCARLRERFGAPGIAGLAQAFALLALCWGALAFGGAYPWGFWPLAAIALTAGAIGCLIPSAAGAARVSRLLVAALALLGAAMVLQLVPLPLAVLRTVSPNALAVLEQTDFAYGAGLTRFHSLSVVASSTLVPLALFVAFAVLVAGTSRSMAVRHPRRLVETLTVFAVIFALIGIVQKPLYAGRVLGFWEPEGTGLPFATFVNRNHFAGWMVMALPLSLGLLAAGLEKAMRQVRPGWRYKLLWLSSPEASRLILLGAGGLIMALSLVLTMSRSGISALALAVVLMGVVVARGIGARSRRAIVIVYLGVLLAATVAWVGTDVLADRFANTNWSEFNDRRGAWLDAVSVIRSFPLVGTGLNTYSTVARFYQQHDLSSFYGEAHNDYLQLLAEGGLLLAIPAGLALAALGWEIRRRMKADLPGTSWWLRRAAVTAMAAIALQETVEFSLQMPGNAVLFAIVCALAIHPPRDGRPDDRPAGSPAQRPRLRVVASNAFAGSR
jgi:O-antigen ligase